MEIRYDDIESSHLLGDFRGFLVNNKKISVKFIDVIYKMIRKLEDFQKIERSDKRKINRAIRLLKKGKNEDAKQVVKELPFIEDAFSFSEPAFIIKRLVEITSYSYVSKNLFPEVSAGRKYLFKKAIPGQPPNLFNFINLYIFILFDYLQTIGFNDKELNNLIVAILMYHPKWHEWLEPKQINLINSFLLSHLKKDKKAYSLWTIKSVTTLKKVEKDIKDIASNDDAIAIDKIDTEVTEIAKLLKNHIIWLLDNFPTKTHLEKIEEINNELTSQTKEENRKKGKAIESKCGVTGGTFISSKNPDYFSDQLNIKNIKKKRLAKVTDELKVSNFYNPPVINETIIHSEKGSYSLPLIDMSNNNPFGNKEIEGTFIIFCCFQYICSTLDLYKEHINPKVLDKAEHIFEYCPAISGGEERVKWFDNQAEHLAKELNLEDSV